MLFRSKRCNPHKVFLKGPVRFVEDNIVEKINNITITDSAKYDITDKFKGLSYDKVFYMAKYNDPNQNEFYSFMGLNNMVNAINDFSEGEKHYGMEEYRNQRRILVHYKNSILFYTESDKASPKSIKITFQTYSIEKKVIEPVEKETYCIYFSDFSEKFYKNKE